MFQNSDKSLTILTATNMMNHESSKYKNVLPNETEALYQGLGYLEGFLILPSLLDVNIIDWFKDANI